MSHNFSDYNPPYLYLLTLFSYLPVGSLYAVKLFQSFLISWPLFFAFKLVDRKYKNETVSVFLSLLFYLRRQLSSMVRIGEQCDIIYSAFFLPQYIFYQKEKTRFLL